jgi:hypothetical protein
VSEALLRRGFRFAVVRTLSDNRAFGYQQLELSAKHKVLMAWFAKG